jgi:amphi-Trp domain-containing protein
MNREKRFHLESLQDRKTICKYLEVLQDGFEQGIIKFSYKDNNLILEPHGLIKFKINAGLKTGEVELSLVFRWEEKEGSRFIVNSPELISDSGQDD